MRISPSTLVPGFCNAVTPVPMGHSFQCCRRAVGHQPDSYRAALIQAVGRKQSLCPPHKAGTTVRAPGAPCVTSARASLLPFTAPPTPPAQIKPSYSDTLPSKETLVLWKASSLAMGSQLPALQSRGLETLPQMSHSRWSGNGSGNSWVFSSMSSHPC